MRNIYLLLVLSINSIVVLSQVDQVYQISLDKIKPGEYLEYTIIIDSTEELFAFSKQDFRDIERIIQLTEVNIDLIDDQEKWIANCDQIYLNYKKLISTQLERVELYKNAYEQQLELTMQLSKSFDNLKKLKNRSSFNTFTTGALIGIPLGLIIGVLLVK